MADLVIKYERIATESAPPTPCKSTSKRAMSLVGCEGSPGPPPAVAGGPPLPASSEGSPPHRGSCVAGDRPSCCRCGQLRSAAQPRESSNKRKRFSGSEAENLKIETGDKTCADGNPRRETPAPSLDARRRPQTQPPPSAAPGANAGKVKAACAAAEIEAYLSAVEREQQRRFAEKYNYDVVNDVPLEGRYEWIPLNAGAVVGNAEATGDGTD
ncbi:hypothetical protein BT93_I1528 [Corymbia citriodora subsp. variegata]|nr:hypothetical protein BT93_I1528 [Corymbia citriodora subsp. variegata]